jgi:hypothetical protein
MLPERVLPNRALQLIREYSKPLTNPNWRRLKVMPQSLYNNIIHNAKRNNALYKLIDSYEYTYTIEDLPFILKKGQSYLYRRIKYTIIDIVPYYNIILEDSLGEIHKGMIYLYYKDRLTNGSLKKMEGVYIPSNIYLNQTNYIHLY